MKRKICYIILSLTLSISFLLFTACRFDVNVNRINGCAGISSGQEEPFAPIPETPPDADADVYKFEIVKDGYFYPTIKGAIFCTKYAHKIVLDFDGEETELTPNKIKNKTNGYIFYFDEIVIYGEISKGTYDYTVKAYYNDDVVNKEIVQSIKVEYNLFAVHLANGSAAMDAEEMWTPFY